MEVGMSHTFRKKLFVSVHVHTYAAMPNMQKKALVSILNRSRQTSSPQSPRIREHSLGSIVSLKTYACVENVEMLHFTYIIGAQRLTL